MNKLLIAAAVLSATAWAQPAAAEARGPVLVEYFTSQGCSDCPSANLVMAEHARTSGVIVLTFPVHYWDYLGWRDTLAQPEFAKRQKSYAKSLGVKGLKTPQAVVHGVKAVAPARVGEAVAKLAASPRPASLVRVTTTTEPGLGRARITVNGEAVGAGARAADVWVASYDPGPVAVDVKQGANAGQRVKHVNVVRELKRVGAWQGGEAAFAANCQPACAVIVQGADGRVLGARVVERATLVSSAR